MWSGCVWNREWWLQRDEVGKGWNVRYVDKYGPRGGGKGCGKGGGECEGERRSLGRGYSTIRERVGRCREWSQEMVDKMSGIG